MRDYKAEFENRVEYIRRTLANAHCDGIVFGNSGGKDCALAGILCKAACDNTVGVIMPREELRLKMTDIAIFLFSMLQSHFNVLSHC